MARRIPLPRLTQSQRSARWQREKRQRQVLLVLFSSVLMAAVALVVWNLANRFYDTNLKPAAFVGDVAVPYREYNREVAFMLTKYYQDQGVPPQYENDPQLNAAKAQFKQRALDFVIEARLLRGHAAAIGFSPTTAQVDARYNLDYGQFRSRHILISPDAKATDKDAADKEALTKAQDIARQLKAAPRDDALWKKLASESSSDPGSKDQGGELGWVSGGQFVKEYENTARAQQPYDVSDPVKTAFGYHVIQLEELRGPEFSELLIRWAKAGIGESDIREHSRLNLIREEIQKRADATIIPSPAPQVRVAQIVIFTPRPTAGDFERFTAAVKKISDMQVELEKGVDFATIARNFSDDPSAENDGEIGWLVRGMRNDYAAENELFSLDSGKQSSVYSKVGSTTVYKVLERSNGRAVTDEQRASVKATALPYTLGKLKFERGVRKLVPGYELD